MIKIKYFTFNPFQENTYILYDESGEAIIIDPGMYDAGEESELNQFLNEKELSPVKLLNSHAHLDHIFGNQCIVEQFGLKTHLHKNEIPILQAAGRMAKVYGLNYRPNDEVEKYLEEGDQIDFGNSKLECLFVPGHSPGHLMFLNREEKFVIGGDVLFRSSIGRTDLPGGNHQQLLSNIRDKVFQLDEDVKVYPGHGDPTSIGFEKRNNPFF